MIQDISPHVFQNAYRAQKPKAFDSVIVIDGRKVLLKRCERTVSGFPETVSSDASGADVRPVPEAQKSGQAETAGFRLPSVADLPQIGFPGDGFSGLTYLFSIDETAFFFLPGTPPARSPFQYENEMILRELEDHDLAFGAATGVQLAQWYTLHHFCGKCGVPTIHSETERAVICPKCGHIYYPRISPVVIIAITDGDRILLTRYNRGGYRRHALVAGFVEIGETLEDAVRREIMEEVGLKVKNIRYVESQPWAFSSSLIAGFSAEADGDPSVRLNTDGKDELASAEWVSRQDLVLEDHSVSLTWDMIRKFRDGIL